MFFLNKLLFIAERNYWSTKLKIVDLVWLIKKTRHLIEFDFSVHITLIFIDHTIVTSIVKQIKLTSFSTDKLNLRLIRASQYLSQFNLNVRYCLDKIHLMSDALSRLLKSSMMNVKFSILNNLFAVDSYSITVYSDTLVEMSKSFQKQIMNAY